MKKKQIIIISSIVLVVAIVIVYIMSTNKVEYISLDNYQSTSYEPEFMSEQEKIDKGLPEDSRIQVLKRNEDGESTVYKVIRDEADVVTDLDSVSQPIDPR